MNKLENIINNLCDTINESNIGISAKPIKNENYNFYKEMNFKQDINGNITVSTKGYIPMISIYNFCKEALIKSQLGDRFVDHDFPTELMEELLKTPNRLVGNYYPNNKNPHNE